MKRLRYLLGAGLCLFILTSAVFAVRVSALYQAKIPVSSQSAEERNRVIQAGLAQVLIKVSGNPQITSNPHVKARLGSANSLMQEFSYASQPATSAKPYVLQLDFDSEGINNLLREAGSPIWGQNRPLILVWLESEIPNQPAEMITSDSANFILPILKQQADRRGLPIIFPAMDVTDLSQVSANDIVTMAIPVLTNAAKRYGSDAILVGRMIQNSNGYTTQWNLVMGDDQWSWTLAGKTPEDALSSLADNVANTLAGRYASLLTNSVQAKITLKITGISEDDDLSQLMNYLKHLTPVTDVQVDGVTGTDVIVSISLRGTQNSFLQAISIGQKLTRVSDDTNQTMAVYQWNH